MEREELTNSNDARDLLFMFGGAALVLLGAGLIISNPQVQALSGRRRHQRRSHRERLPDFERYMKLRSM